MWIALTEEKLLTRMSGLELDAFRSVALKDGQADPVQGLFDQITRKVRSRVAACMQNKLGPEGTIPDELLDDALALCVMGVMTRPAGTVIDPNDARTKSAAQAESNLRDAAMCKIAIEQPPVAEESTEVIGAPSPKIAPRPRRFTQCTEDGI
jgi:hypothetical protein